MGGFAHPCVLAVVTSLGCTVQRELPLPPDTVGMRSLLLNVHNTSAVSKRYAIDLDAPHIPVFSAQEDGLITALLFDRTLAELGIPTPGVIEEGTDPDRMLRPSSKAFERIDDDWRDLSKAEKRRRSGESASPPQSSAELLEIAERMMLPEGPRCLLREGCLVPYPPGSDPPVHMECLIPCPEQNPPSAPSDPEPPASPNPPAFGVCPAGWASASTSTAGITFDTCVPWSRGDRPQCAAVPSMGCIAIGSTCPGSGWANNLPTGRPILYVDPSYVGGDGTKAAPFGGLSDAIAAATAGTVIAISTGQIAGPIQLTSDVALWGACPGSTVLAPVEIQQASVSLTNLSIEGDVRIDGGNATLVDVSISSTSTVGIWAVDGSVDARAIAVAGAIQLSSVTASITKAALQGGIVADGGTLHARDVAITDGVGVAIENGSATLEEVVLEQTLGLLFDGATASLDRLIVRDSREENGDGGGLEVANGSEVSAERLIVEGNPSAVSVYENGVLSLADAVLADSSSYGLIAYDNGHAKLDRVFIHKSFEGALVVYASTASVTDFVAIDIDTDDPTERGYGVIANDVSEVQLTRGLIHGFHRAGARARPAGTVLQLTDVRIREAQYEAGAGVFIGEGAALVAERVRIERSKKYGLEIANLGTTATLYDVTVEEMQPSTEENTAGLFVIHNALVTAERLAITNAIGQAMRISHFGNVTVSDLVVEDTQCDDAGLAGDGLYLSHSTLDLSRARFRRNHTTGLSIRNQAILNANDIDVTETQPAGCALTHCPDSYTAGGVGLYVSGATATLTQFVLSSGQVGLKTNSAPEVFLHRGTITGFELGAEILDLANIDTISDRVLFLDNAALLTND